MLGHRVRSTTTAQICFCSEFAVIWPYHFGIYGSPSKKNKWNTLNTRPTMTRSKWYESSLCWSPFPVFLMTKLSFWFPVLALLYLYNRQLFSLFARYWILSVTGNVNEYLQIRTKYNRRTSGKKEASRFCWQHFDRYEGPWKSGLETNLETLKYAYTSLRFHSVKAAKNPRLLPETVCLFLLIKLLA